MNTYQDLISFLMFLSEISVMKETILTIAKIKPRISQSKISISNRTRDKRNPAASEKYRIDLHFLPTSTVSLTASQPNMNTCPDGA